MNAPLDNRTLYLVNHAPALQALAQLQQFIPGHLLRSHSGRERQMLLVSVSRDLAARTVKSYSNVP